MNRRNALGIFAAVPALGALFSKTSQAKQAQQLRPAKVHIVTVCKSLHGETLDRHCHMLLVTPPDVYPALVPDKEAEQILFLKNPLNPFQFATETTRVNFDSKHAAFIVPSKKTPFAFCQSHWKHSETIGGFIKNGIISWDDLKEIFPNFQPPCYGKINWCGDVLQGNEKIGMSFHCHA